jgi:hypothetical protein
LPAGLQFHPRNISHIPAQRSFARVAWLAIAGDGRPYSEASRNHSGGNGEQTDIGGSIDHSKIGFRANSELGYVFPDLFVGPNAAVPGTGQIIHTAANLGFSPVSLDAQNTYYGVYAIETFDVTTRLSLTAGRATTSPRSP